MCVCFIVDDLVLERTKRREFGGSRSERARVSAILAACVWGVWADQF